MNYILDILNEKVNRMWPNEGQKWLDKLPELVEKYIIKWKLSDVTVPSVTSISFIGFCKSPQYGDVVLKIGYPHLEMYTSIDSLLLNHEGKCCTLYEADREDCSMLMERIIPGYTLKEEEFEIRLKIGANAVNELPILISD